MSSANGTQFDILRHGSIDGPPALYGKTDVGLSELGWTQIRRQASRLASIDNVISSPLRRCREFAEQFAASRDLSLKLEPSLQECDFGEWDGIVFDEASAHWPLMKSFWQDPANNSPPQGESLPSFHNRVVKGWDELRERHQGQRNLLVCHGGVIRQILAHVLSTDWRSGDWYSHLQISYASLTRITIAAQPEATPIVNFIAIPADFAQADPRS